MLFFVLFNSIRLTEPSEIICQQLVDLYKGLGRQKSDPREFFAHLRFIRCLLQDFRMMVPSDDLKFKNAMQILGRLDEVADGVLENLYKVYFEFEEWDLYDDDFRNYFVWLTEFLDKGATDFEKRVFITFESFVNNWLDFHRKIHNLNSLGDVYSTFLEEFYKLISEDGKVHASFRSESNKFIEKYTALKNFGFIKKRLLKQSTKLFGIILENKGLNLPNNTVRRIAEMAMIHLLPFTKNILATNNTKIPFCQAERRKLPHFRSSFAEQGAQEDFFQILDDMTK